MKTESGVRVKQGMRYISVCSGIEAATVAYHTLGWTPLWFSEVDPFPSAVLWHHYPHVKNMGDMTRFQEWPDANIDILVGGTPCQSFSVAGLRKGLDDPRGNLMLTYVAIARRYRPRWVVWENVPGVLSSDSGRDFAQFVGLFTGQHVTPPIDGWQNSGICHGPAGYGLAWRVLDAQHFGVPQRRRRIFVVGYLGDWRRAAAVLFERHSLQGHHPPRRQAGEGVAGTLEASVGRSRGAGISPGLLAPTLPARTNGGGGLGTDFDLDGGLIAQYLTTGTGRRYDPETETLIASTIRNDGMKVTGCGVGIGASLVPDIAPCLTRNYGKQADSSDTSAGPMLIPIHQPYTLAIRGRGDSHDLEYRQDGTANALLTPNGGRGGIGVGAVAFNWQGGGEQTTLGYDLDAGVTGTLHVGQVPAVKIQSAVRRLTPIECERLQGFPDGYTQIPTWNGWRKVDTDENVDDLKSRGMTVKQTKSGWKVNDPDGPRYKALGNSMAVPVMRWIGMRIGMIETLEG